VGSLYRSAEALRHPKADNRRLVARTKALRHAKAAIHPSKANAGLPGTTALRHPESNPQQLLK